MIGALRDRSGIQQMNIFSMRNHIQKLGTQKGGLEDGRQTRKTHRKIAIIELSILFINFACIYINVLYVFHLLANS